MSDESRGDVTARNGDSHPATVSPRSPDDAAKLLTAVMHLLPPGAAVEVEAWSRGERSASAAIARLQGLPGDSPPAPEWKPGPDVRELTQQLRELAERSPPFDAAA